MAKLRATHRYQVSAVALSTTIAETWDPPAGDRLRIMSFSTVENTSAADVILALTDGTAAASGTVALIPLNGGTLTPSQEFAPDAGIPLSLNSELGLKVLAGVATVSFTIFGREESF